MFFSENNFLIIPIASTKGDKISGFFGLLRKDLLVFSLSESKRKGRDYSVSHFKIVGCSFRCLACQKKCHKWDFGFFI